jgi:hypothetical protein
MLQLNEHINCSWLFVSQDLAEVDVVVRAFARYLQATWLFLQQSISHVDPSHPGVSFDRLCSVSAVDNSMDQ